VKKYTSQLLLQQFQRQFTARVVPRMAVLY